MGHHGPKHIETDIREMVRLQLDDVLVSAQENDFVHFTGKIEFTSRITKDHGLRPIAIFWGVLNLFGGGRSSQFLLEHPEGFQVRRDGSRSPAGCDVQDMVPILRDLHALCKGHGKIHHEWLQCWNVKSGRENRIVEQGKMIIQEQPDTLYVWAWQGQVGTNRSLPGSAGRVARGLRCADYGQERLKEKPA